MSWDEPDSFVKSGKFLQRRMVKFKANHSDVYCVLPLPDKAGLIQNRTPQRLLKCFATGITVLHARVSLPRFDWKIPAALTARNLHR